MLSTVVRRLGGRRGVLPLLRQLQTTPPADQEAQPEPVPLKKLKDSFMGR
jgi:hypothetical protein